MKEENMIEISVNINAPISEVWEKWINVEGVKHWAFASNDWAAEGIENDVTSGGKFSNRNYAKDGSMEFIFGGTYTDVEPQKTLKYILDDKRRVEVSFKEIE